MLALGSFRSYGITEITQTWILNSDYESDAFRISSADIQQNGYKLTVKDPGIEVGRGIPSIITEGTLTSNASFLSVNLLSERRESQGHAYIVIESIITDSAHLVGLCIRGNEEGEGALYMRGNQSNTFTGNVEISGRRNHLVLDKDNGAVAVRGNISVRDRALVRFAKSNQTRGTSNIILKNYGVIEYGENPSAGITNTLKDLIVEDHGVVYFYHWHGAPSPSKHYIYFDDLIINTGGHLEIQNWQDDRDFLLVRKTSNNLADSLTKIAFSGYTPNNIHLEDFNDEYWSISATPEPATYGAILGVGGIGLVAWRKHRRSTDRTALRQSAPSSQTECASTNSVMAFTLAGRRCFTMGNTSPRKPSASSKFRRTAPEAYREKCILRQA